MKPARVVGDVMGKYHPHGDQAIYDSLVRMAQPFSMGLMLIDGQGNFGSIDNDPPAQMRYTECRLAKAAVAMLADIDRDAVDFKENYDGKESEPPTVYSDGLTGASYLDKPQEVGAYEAVWASIRSASLDETQSKKLIATIAEEYASS